MMTWMCLHQLYQHSCLEQVQQRTMALATGSPCCFLQLFRPSCVGRGDDLQVHSRFRPLALEVPRSGEVSGSQRRFIHITNKEEERHHAYDKAMKTGEMIWTLEIFHALGFFLFES
eukprot:scpid97804/ scgid29141/ 